MLRMPVLNKSEVFHISPSGSAGRSKDEMFPATGEESPDQSKSRHWSLAVQAVMFSGFDTRRMVLLPKLSVP